MTKNKDGLKASEKECPKCHEVIKLAAKNCKHCGSDLRSLFAKHKVLTGVLVLIVIAFIVNLFDDEPSYYESQQVLEIYEEQNEKEEQALAALSGPEYKVDAVSLYQEFQNNSLAADAKYSGKFIEVTGKFDGADSNYITDEPYIKLATDTGGYFGLLDCYYSDSESVKALALNKGDSVTVLGKFTDYTISMRLESCTIQ